jgi:hypothetical protein
VKQLGAVPMMREDAWRALALTPMLEERNARRVPDGYVPLYYDAPKGSDPGEWPEDLRVRELPR